MEMGELANTYRTHWFYSSFLHSIKESNLLWLKWYHCHVVTWIHRQPYSLFYLLRSNFVVPRYVRVVRSLLFVWFVSSLLQNARHTKEKPFVFEHLGNRTEKLIKLWKQMFIHTFAFDEYYHTHKKKCF